MLLVSALGMSREGAWHYFTADRAPPHPPGPTEARSMRRPPIDAIFGGAPLPPRRKLYIPIVCVEPGQPVAGFLLSPLLHVVETHHIDQRTKPCTKKAGKCHGCDIGCESRWTAFLAYTQPPSGRVFLLALTPAAVRECPILAKGEECVRGWQFRAFRKGKKKRSPLRIELTPKPDSANLPPEPPVREALLNIWGWFTPEGPPGRRDDPPDAGSTVPV